MTFMVWIDEEISTGDKIGRDSMIWRGSFMITLLDAGQGIDFVDRNAGEHRVEAQEAAFCRTDGRCDFFAIAVCVCFDNGMEAAAAGSTHGLCGVVWALVKTIDDAITVGIRVGCSASTGAFLDFIGIVRTCVEAIERAIIVAVIGVFRETATAYAGLCFFGILRTDVQAVGSAVAIGIGIRRIASTGTGGGSAGEMTFLNELKSEQ